MTPNIEAQASQAATQGQQMLQNDQNQANSYRGQFGNYQSQADAANRNVQDYTNAMRGAYNAQTGTGNAQSAFDYNQGTQLAKAGYNQDAMTTASNYVNQDLGQIASARDFMNQAGSKWGMNAGAQAAFNANALGSLNDTLNAHQGIVQQLLNKYNAGSQQANSIVGLQQKGQEDTIAGLQSVYTNAANQRDQALSMLQFYENLASNQGTLNAQQQSAYASARSAYASATAAMAQAALDQQKYQQQAKLFADQQAAATSPNTGIGILAPGHTGITDRNGNVIGVYNPNAGTTPAASTGSTGGYNPISEFFTNPHALGQQIGTGIGNAASSVWNAAGNRLASNARIFGL